MKVNTPASNPSYVEKEGGDGQFSREIVFGDLIWIKLHGSSWWPAQVVDENTVSEVNKPSNKSVGEVLVRLYGSYKFLYVDPIRCRSEFENILKENNGSYREILKKALEQARVSPRKSRAKTPPTKVKCGNLLSEKVDNTTSKKRNQEGERKKLEPNSPKSSRFTPRRLPAVSTPQTVEKNDKLPPEKIPKARGKKQRQDGVHNNIESNSPSAERLSSRQLLENTEEAKSGRQKQDRVHKKLKMDHPSSARISPRQPSAAAKPQTLTKNGYLHSEKAEAAKITDQKDVKKKLEHRPSVKPEPCPSRRPNRVKSGNALSEKTEKETSSIARNQGLHKNPKPNSRSALAVSPTTLQTPKQVGVLKKQKTNGPDSVTTLVGKSQELSARKMKVMQSLGLIAPFGSPFLRNG